MKSLEPAKTDPADTRRTGDVALRVDGHEGDCAPPAETMRTGDVALCTGDVALCVDGHGPKASDAVVAAASMAATPGLHATGGAATMTRGLRPPRE